MQSNSNEGPNSLEGLTLYSFRRCPFAIRVRTVLEEKRIPYQVIEEDLSNPSKDLLALHPEGRVPLLVHQMGTQKHIIYQSTIITEYLDETFPSSPLMPKDPVLRSHVRLWTYWCDYLFKPDLDLFKYDLSTLQETESKALIDRIHAHLQKWDQALQLHPFLLGEGMSLADIHLFPFARQLLAIRPGLPGVEKYTKITEWLSLMTQRPVFERVMKKQDN